MENACRGQERENLSPHNSPKSNGGSNNNSVSSSCSNTINNGGGAQQPQFLQTPPVTPKPISRSETTNPYPTTFVQADTTTFKHVVQMLTGSSETAKHASRPPPQDPPSSKGHVIPPIKTVPKKPSFKLYERRGQAQSLKNSLMINTLIPGFSAANSGFSPRHQQEILSPSILDFPKLALSSPVTPLNDDPFNRTSPSLGNSSSEEDRAIAEKGFYLHPSPMSTPRDGGEPQLLPLFPVTSPRVSGSSS